MRIRGEEQPGERIGIIKDEMTLRLTEAEFARDIHAVLARVREEGLEVIVEQDHRPWQSSRHRKVPAGS